MYYIRRLVWNVHYKKGGDEVLMRRVVWNVLYKKGGVECTL